MEKSQLRKRGFHADVIHSDLRQSHRERIFHQLREHRLHLLVATDIVGRGIDVTGISHIINYDAPEDSESYVHRIGRTGRAERSGKAAPLGCELDGRRTRDIEKLLGESIRRVKLERFDYRLWPVEGSARSAGSGRRPGGRRGGSARPPGGSRGGARPGGRNRRRGNGGKR